MIGLFKTEVINQIGPWKSMREVEWETLKWVDWYNNRRLLGPNAQGRPRTNKFTRHEIRQKLPLYLRVIPAYLARR